MIVFWKLFPLLLGVVQHGGSILIERYRAKRAEKEALKADIERRMAQEERNEKRAVVPSQDNPQSP